MAINVADVQKLRQATGVGMMDAKNALAEANGDFEKAQEILRKKGVVKAAKKAGRETREGIIGHYLHGDKIGVLVEVNSETDFVALNEVFKNFVHELAMHIAAAAPLYVKREDVPADVVEKEKAFYLEELKSQNKPAQFAEKIVQGKLDKYFSQIVLLEQPYIKDDSKKINDLLTETIAKLGENIQIRRFCRFQLGE